MNSESDNDNISTSSGDTSSMTGCGTEDESYLVLASTKVFYWTIYYTTEHQDATGVEFPIQASLGVPSMTIKMSFKYASLDDYNESKRFKFTYSCDASEEGEATPMYKASISFDHHSSWDWDYSFHTTGLQNTGGSCLVECHIPRGSTRGCDSFKIRLDFYANRYTGEGNFYADSWNERHQPTMAMHFLDVLESGKNSDVKIISGDAKEFDAHKFILTARSEVFDAMFRHDMEESTTGVVKLEDMSGKAVKFLLHFIYSSQILKISPNEDEESASFEEVLYLADKFGLTELKHYLDKNIYEFCFNENSLRLLKLCKLHSLENGKEKIFGYIREYQPKLLTDFLWSHI